MSSNLQLDVCQYKQWWRHLVNAYEVEASTVLFVLYLPSTRYEHIHI